LSAQRAAIILAAGKGKRMRSDLPKVLHEIHGRPMIRILLDRLTRIGFDRLVVVVGHKAEAVERVLSHYPVTLVRQEKQLGTAHAVKMTRGELADFEGITLVAAGDVPFLSERSIERLFETHIRNGAVATCLSAIFEDPTGYGRIIRDGHSDRLKAIVEHKDASPEQRAIHEINTGTFCFDNKLLFEAIEEIGCDNAQGEYYLTDAVEILHRRGLPVAVVTAENPDEVRGVNSVDQLKTLEARFSLD
jgi:UDP-N-acetylglucosamine diphosphorylase/glucosamine-1-phosphate N-acetyltransferase